jgi:electron transport complex protein RnfC
MGLQPLEMAANIRNGDFEKARSLGLNDCVGCGACSYICPASLPLVHLFNYAKGELANRQREARKMEKTRVLAQRREERVTRQAREREELMAARRAAAARKAAEEEEAAGEENPS